MLRDWFKHSFAEHEIRDRWRIEKHLIQPGEIDNYPDYSKILFIRDPFRRLVSFYCQWVVGDDRLWCFADDEKNHSLHGKSFSEFLGILEDLADRGLAFQHHLEPQMNNVGDVQFDLVIAVEQLKAQLTKVNEELGIEHQVTMFNATPYDETLTTFAYDASPESLARKGIPRYQYFYSPDLAGKVERLYREDLDCYRAFHDDSALFKKQVSARELA